MRGSFELIGILGIKKEEKKVEVQADSKGEMTLEPNRMLKDLEKGLNMKTDHKTITMTGSTRGTIAMKEKGIDKEMKEATDKTGTKDMIEEIEVIEEKEEIMATQKAVTKNILQKTNKERKKATKNNNKKRNSSKSAIIDFTHP